MTKYEKILRLIGDWPVEDMEKMRDMMVGYVREAKEQERRARTPLRVNAKDLKRMPFLALRQLRDTLVGAGSYKQATKVTRELASRK